ncbi:GIY-YIG nuclease family protein [Patescibacteria group bacterium]|nr:GIY-YIG nuclease family protein [Patescibacteria group bacterium]
MGWVSLKPFTRFSVMLTPNQPGLYALNDSGGRIIYIGGSDELQRRLTEHLPENEAQNLCIKRSAAQFQYLVSTNWQQEERRLIETYQPSCNRI